LDHFPVEFKYNFLEYAFSSIGYKHIEETKQIIADLRKGTALSQETKQKLSIQATGSKNAFYGKKHDPALLASLSAKRMGVNNPMYGKPKSLEFIAQQKYINKLGK
jgi:group I intron endonuclease